jgi:formylglycine-generating enzyme required for sulfatase activity
MLSPGDILQNRYRIVRELGQGGMGAVYEAIDQRLTSKVALKEMLGARDVHARNAFEREAALLANLNHPNLPRVTDHFSENDGAYLVMQFIEGMDLAEWLDLRAGPFPQVQVLQWADTLLDVLEYLHGNDPPILHRDIKPANIKRTQDGRIYLLDFGLAKGSFGQMPTYETSRSIRGGTHYYSPLEQFSGPNTDGRSDLYALGATLYHMISDVLPADAGLRHQAMQDDEPDPLQELAGFASPRVASVIEKAMSPSRKQRFDSATEMRRALEHAATQDERDRLKDEYRRAEERRRQRDEERKRASEEAERRAEQERQLLEAETKRKKALEQQKAATLRQQELELQRKEDDERLQREAKMEEARLVAEREAEEQLPSTIPPPVLPTAGESSAKLVTPRVITTIPVPPPERLQTAREAATRAPGETSRIVSVRTKRWLAVAAVIVALVVAIGGIFLLPRRGTISPDETASRQPQPGITSQSDQTQKPPQDIKPPEGMVYVPGGTFQMGRNKDDGGDEYESPAHSVTVKPFFIDIYEVTNEEYAKFVKATNRMPPPGWMAHTYPSGSARKPVIGVTWGDANAYAKWVGKELPTEQQWEFAARGPKSLRYPWGNSWKAGCANANIDRRERKQLADVGSHNCDSPFGTFDLIGNAWEWTASELTPYENGKILPDRPPGDLRVIRGASYIEDKEATATYRRGYPVSGDVYDKTGFRCVKNVP